MNRILFFVVTILCLIATASFADTISLRSSVRMPADGRALTLADAAVLQGEEAQRFAGMQLQPGRELAEAIEIDVHAIQQQLDEEGANWAKVALSGGMVVVRPRVTARVIAELNTAVLPDSSGVALGDNSIGSDVAGDTRFRSLETWTLEGNVPAMIAAELRAAWGDQAPLLHASIDLAAMSTIPSHATSISVEPRGSVRGADWFDVQVRAERAGDRFRPTKTVLVRVDVRVKSQTTLAAARLTSNRTIRLDDLKSGTAMLKPTDAARALEPSHFIGRRLRRVVEAGEPVLTGALEPEVVVQRKDRVRVVMHGAFQLSGTDAIALERGAIGEIIKCRWRAGDEAFSALITAPGEVRVGQ